MVKIFKHTHRYDDQPSTVLLAFYLRYPNPHATHVLSCDVISRQVDPIRGAITTQRLILKKGIVPRWARTWLENWGMMGGGGLEAWVLEESEVTIDASTNLPVLTSMTRNISHKKIIHVAEDVQFHPAAGPARGTIQTTTAYVSSNFGSGSGLSSLLRGRIEQYGAGRFERNARNAREGMSLILSLLRNYEPLPHTSEAETAAESPTRQYGYNYATRRNVRGATPNDDDEEDESSRDDSTLRPGWARGRRFRYDQPESDIGSTRSARPTPISSFTSRTISAEYSHRSPSSPSSSIQTTSRNESDNPLTITNSITMTGISGQDHAPAPASFFLSKRNPGLYPGLREKLKGRKEAGYDPET